VREKRLWTMFVILFLICTATGGLGVSVGATSSMPRIFVDPPTSTVLVGQTFGISVSVVNITDDDSLYGWEMELTFDPTVLKALSVTEGPFLKKAGDTFWIPPQIDNAAGTVKAGSMLIFPFPPKGAVGDGTLATIAFKALSGGITALGLKYTSLSTIKADIPSPIVHTKADGEVTAVPVADANGPYSCSEGSPITFDASGSTPSSGEIVLYEWDWDNDGTYDETTASPTINHTWFDDYTGTVGLRVTDSAGLMDTDVASVTVNNVAPTVEAGTNQTVSRYDTVSFSGTFTDPGAEDTHTFFWDFGDETNTTGTLTPTHVYKEADIYTVTLKITDDDGEFGTDTLDVTVLWVSIHDIAITNITASPLMVNVTDPTQPIVTIRVQVANNGDFHEIFNITVRYDSQCIDTKTRALSAGGSSTVVFYWNVKGVSPMRTYKIEAEAILVEDAYLADNKMTSEWSIEVVSEFPTEVSLLLVFALLAASTIVLKRRRSNNL